MQKTGFDAEKYIEEQSKYILERINHGESERLYLEFGGKLVHDKHAMRVLPGFDENAKIKLIFENYLLYQVRNESYCVFDADEVRGGTYLCTFERSKLLDYLPRAIDVHLIPDGTDAPASWKHYGIYTQNQIIDIVAPSEPTVRTSF